MNHALRRISLVMPGDVRRCCCSASTTCRGSSPPAWPCERGQRRGPSPSSTSTSAARSSPSDNKIIAESGARQGHLQLPAALPGPDHVRAGDRLRLALQRHRHRAGGGQVAVRVRPAAHGAQPDRPDHREAEAGRDRPAHRQLGRPDGGLRTRSRRAGCPAARSRSTRRPARSSPWRPTRPSTRTSTRRSTAPSSSQIDKQLPAEPSAAAAQPGHQRRPSRPAPPSRS